jgi:hypothetical protein
MPSESTSKIESWIPVKVGVNENQIDFQRNHLTGLYETIIADSVLPKLCTVCNQAGSSAQELRFLGMLPSVFWKIVIGLPALFLIGILLAVFTHNEDLLKVFAICAAGIGMFLGLLGARGEMRRR